MATTSLTPETFLAVTEMVAAHLRVKEIDRWSPHVCKLKFHSFTTEFPEVNETQFMWAAEQWVQNCGPGFTRYPTWRELMAALYRTENGLANRSWGFRPELPSFVTPTAKQLAMLPTAPASIAAAADPTNAAAYALFASSDQPLLSPARKPSHLLTDEVWQTHLERCHEIISEAQGTTADPGTGAAGRPMERDPVQPARRGARASERGVP